MRYSKMRRTNGMNLKGRHFLTLKDFTQEEIVWLLDLAADFKEKKKNGVPVVLIHPDTANITYPM